MAPAASQYDHVRIGSKVFPFPPIAAGVLAGPALAKAFAEVSAAYRNTIDRLGIGASRTPPCRIYDASGRQTAYVSYNGRVWTFDPANPHADPNANFCLYDPHPHPNPSAAGALPFHRYAPEALAGMAV